MSHGRQQAANAMHLPVRKAMRVLRAQQVLVEAAAREAKCIRCGCTDSRACRGGCSWVWVSYTRREGLCTRCAE